MSGALKTARPGTSGARWGHFYAGVHPPGEGDDFFGDLCLYVFCAHGWVFRGSVSGFKYNIKSHAEEGGGLGGGASRSEPLLAPA